MVRTDTDDATDESNDELTAIAEWAIELSKRAGDGDSKNPVEMAFAEASNDEDTVSVRIGATRDGGVSFRIRPATLYERYTKTHTNPTTLSRNTSGTKPLSTRRAKSFGTTPTFGRFGKAGAVPFASTATRANLSTCRFTASTSTTERSTESGRASITRGRTNEPLRRRRD